MRLGRLPHDPAALAAVPRHYAATLPPPVLDRSHIPFTPGLYGNDVFPDCTAVALANAARAASWVTAGCDLVVADSAPPAFYARCVGVADDPAAIEATDGAQMLSVLGQADAQGFDVGPQALVPTWASCPVTARFSLAHAMTMGALYFGAGLAGADQGAGTWDTTTPGDQTRGSWGGHALIAWDYTGLGDGDIVRLGTWGRWQAATWRWVQARADEAYALAWRQIGAVA